MNTKHPSCRQGRREGGALRSPLDGFRGTREGSLLLEAMIAIGVFAIFLGGIGGALIAGQQITAASADRTRAAYIAEQQLEGLRQMRAANFSSITTGQHGLIAKSTGWAYTGTTVMNNGYQTSVTVTSLGTDWLKVLSTVGWNFGKSRSGSVVLETYITNWRKSATIGNWANMTRVNNTSVGGGAVSLQKMTIAGSYAYITSTTAGEGKGLYIYDISTPTNPVPVATDFNLGVSAYGAVAIGNRLYLATGSDTQELQVFDITSPTTLSTSNLLKSYDIPGSSKARTIAVYGSNVFVGSLDDPPNEQLYSIAMSETGPMALLDSMSVTGSVLDMSLRDGYAYIANSNNAGELHVIDIFDPSNLAFAPNVGIDLTDVQDGSAIITSGTSALIGRLEGSTISELTLYDVNLSPVPSPPPGPWTLEIGGDVNSLATIPGSQYAFVGGNASAAQLKVLSLTIFAQGGTPVVKTYNAGAAMKDLEYDLVKDRLYGITAGNLMVFAPG